jgi:hypothetical protein
MDEDLTPAEEPPATDVETLAQAAGTPAVGARPLVPTAENPAPETTDRRVDCVICSDEFSPGEALAVLDPCGHAFHHECLRNMRGKAPLRACVTCHIKSADRLSTFEDNLHPLEGTPSGHALRMPLEYMRDFLQERAQAPCPTCRVLVQITIRTREDHG